MILADQTGGGGETAVLTSAYRDCYGSCRSAGGDVATCMEQCASLIPGSTTAPTSRGPCENFLDCFITGFEVPPAVRQLPGAVADVVGEVSAPINRTLLLVGAAALALVWLRRS